MSSVLITGAAGFIGSHVADAFLRDGWRVSIMDDFSTGARRNVPDGADVVETSIASPAAARHVESCDADVLIHCAAQVDVRESVADPLHDATTNVLGTLNLLDALRKRSRRPRFVYASSGGAIYGGFEEPPYPETSQKEPESPYGFSKLAGEYYSAIYSRLYELDTITLRFANVYGPRQDSSSEAGVVAIFCRRILAGEPLTIFGSGEQTRDYVFVADVARAVRLAATCEVPASRRMDDRAFNIGTGKATSVLTLAEKLLLVVGRAVPIEHAAERPGEQQRSVLDVKKASEALRWEPRVGLDEGLGLTYEWFRDSRRPNP